MLVDKIFSVISDRKVIGKRAARDLRTGATNDFNRDEKSRFQDVPPHMGFPNC